MLYLLHGADTYRSRAKLRTILGRFSTQPDYKSRLFSIEAEYFDIEQFKELIAARPLFGNTFVVVARQLLGNSELKAAVCDMLPALAASGNLFFFLEGELERQTVERFKMHAAEIQEFRPLSSPAIRRWLAERALAGKIAVSRQDIDMLVREHGADLFALEQALAMFTDTGNNARDAHTIAGANDIFAAADAIFGGTRCHAWVALQDFFYRGGSAEELFWKLIWQVKNIVIVKQITGVGRNTASESGLHPFVAKKSLRLGAKFECAMLSRWWEELIGSWHDSRIGGSDLRTVIERAGFRLHPAEL